VLDLFVNNSHRRFYQYFNHNAGAGEYTQELYAGSPSYFISGGGVPTGFCYRADFQAPVQAALAVVSSYFLGIPGVLLELYLQDQLNGKASDLGAAMPTLFMPTGMGHDASDMIQFGNYTTDKSRHNLGVAPDFACGGPLYLPDWVKNDPNKVTLGSWNFVNHGGAPGQPGFYLAWLNAPMDSGGVIGVLEAYDTLHHPGFATAPAFTDFVNHSALVNGGRNYVFDGQAVNTYETLSGAQVRFRVDSKGSADIVGTTAMAQAPWGNSNFADGDIVKSAPGSGIVYIRNNFLGTTVTLDMSDMRNPRRTSETGEVETGREELWVNFNYGDGSGDFAQPVRTLNAAKQKLTAANPPRVLKLIAGATTESVVLDKPVKLVAVGGPVTITAP
jgi:hypothetical protein